MNPWSRDWRYYEIPWGLQPHPPWDAAPNPGYPPLPPGATPWLNYSSVTVYSTTYWQNAPVATQSFDPFRGWTAQDETEEDLMRPAVPGLTSP